MVRALIVNNRRFDIRQEILSERSSVFKAIFSKYSSRDEIKLKTNNETIFELFLNYIYHHKLKIYTLELDKVLGILDLAHTYRITSIEIEIEEYLQSILSVENVCTILNVLDSHPRSNFKEKCYEFIDRNTSRILVSQGFMRLSAIVLQKIISRNTFSCPEIEIFHAACQWIEQNGVEKSIFSKIRLSLMGEIGLREMIAYCQINRKFNFDWSWFESCPTGENIVRNYRGLLIPFENIATIAKGARIIEGIHGEEGRKDGDDMINGNETTYLWTNYTRHFIGKGDPSAIVVQLSQAYIVDTIRMRLWDEDARVYKFYIETSIDKENWSMIVDRRNEACRSWQEFNFDARSMTYIRLIGIDNSANNRFHVVHFECSCKRTSAEIPNSVQNGHRGENRGLVEEESRIEDLVDIDYENNSIPLIAYTSPFNDESSTNTSSAYNLIESLTSSQQSISLLPQAPPPRRLPSNEETPSGSGLDNQNYMTQSDNKDPIDLGKDDPIRKSKLWRRAKGFFRK